MQSLPCLGQSPRRCPSLSACIRTCRRRTTISSDRVAIGRSVEARPPSEEELRSTLVLALELNEVSAKVRTGDPLDDEADLDWPVWAGVIPLRLVAGEREPAADLRYA